MASRVNRKRAAGAYDAIHIKGFKGETLSLDGDLNVILRGSGTSNLGKFVLMTNGYWAFDPVNYGSCYYNLKVIMFIATVLKDKNAHLTTIDRV
jgi:hypothetical protein